MADRIPNPLPIEQVHQFWSEVEENLRSRHSLQGDQPVRAILRYRNEIERVGPLVYHQNPADVADDIVSGEYVRTERMAG
jgi:hypothetical protein